MIKTFAEAEQALAESLPTYESRPQQQSLAKAVEDGIAAKRHVVAEAGCGTGKSFGYSIPSILHAVNSKTAKVGVAAKREQVLISTATKALQNQLVDGDLPFLHDNLGVPFDYAILKGRSNYICRARLEEPENADLKNTVLNELGETFFDLDYIGDVESLSTPLTSMDRANITITSDECPGKRDCPFGNECFAEKAKARAKEADVVVVNHALTFTDLVIREKTAGAVSMLPDYSVIIFDEAHEIEEIAGNILGSKVTEAGLRNLASTVRNFGFKYDINVEKHVNALGQHAGELFESFDSLLANERVTVMRVRQNHLMAAQSSWMGVFNALKSMGETIDEKYMGEDKDTIRKQQTMVRRVTNMVDKFRSMIGDPFDVTVRWIEKETVTNPRSRKTTERIGLNFAPIDVGSWLRANLWEKQDKDGRRKAPTAILTSATMSVDGSFDYITERLGLDNYDGIDVGTPFDFKTQAGLYVPTTLPEPTPANRQVWAGQAQIQMLELIKASGGGALVLFSSVKEMKSAYEMLSELLPYNCFYQGMPGMSRADLARAFKDDTHSVLFATKSFFTGVDFQGDTCRLVIMDKLPFAVPTDALYSARVEAVEKKLGNGYKAFMQYSVPLMSLILKQGFGRLIRHRNDKGVVAILDPRLFTKKYGKTILNSLPDAPRLSSLAEVASMYDTAA